MREEALAPSIDEVIVRRLLTDQYPSWSELPLRPLLPWGTDKAMYRLGDEMTVRLPRAPWSARSVAKECRWLPHLAPRLPLAVPKPLALGRPGHGYPRTWGVYEWIAGATPVVEPLRDLGLTARSLGLPDRGGAAPQPRSAARTQDPFRSAELVPAQAPKSPGASSLSCRFTATALARRQR